MTTVILGSGVDATLEGVASTLLGEATVLRPADLSRVGWCLDPDDPLAGTFVASGTTYTNQEVSRVVVTMRGIAPGELPWFDEADDRAYVASEMTALLRAWVSCYAQDIVVGAPQAGPLAGAAWRDRQWRSLLGDNGLAFEPTMGDGDYWACWLGGAVSTNDVALEKITGDMVDQAPINYLWLEADRVNGELVVRSVRSHPRFDDPRERAAIIEQLNGVSS